MKALDLSSHLRDLFSLLDIGCVFDVGANTGQYRNFLREHVDYKGMILSFEPVSSLADQMMKKVDDDPGWKVFQLALGSLNSTRSINIMKGSTLNSFLEPTSSATKELDADNKVLHREPVHVKTLDTFLKEFDPHGTLPRIFLKMDTQGFDLEVLKGAQESLPRISALQSEISVLPIYRDMPNYHESIDRFQKDGFDVTGMFPVTRDRWLRVLEFDCVAINRAFIGEKGQSETR